MENDGKKKAAPIVFISYSHDDDDHISWVRDLAARLRQNGIDARLDNWEVKHGGSLTAFMKTIRPADSVVIVMTPAYAKKSDANQGGVGYETQLIDGDILAGAPREKFIPVLRSGSHDIHSDDCAIPISLNGTRFIDFRGVDQRVPAAPLRELVAAIREEGGPPAIILPTSRVRASTSHAPGFRADDGYSVGSLRRAVGEQVDARYEPADILRHFIDEGIERDIVRRVLWRHFGINIP